MLPDPAPARQCTGPGDLDAPDGLHAELGVLGHLDLLDAILRETGGRLSRIIDAMRSAPDVARLLSPRRGPPAFALLLLLGCGAAPRPDPAPAGVPLVRPGVAGELADLARRAEIVVSAVVVQARPTRRGCQRVWQLELLPVTVLKGRADFFDVGVLAEAPEGACAEPPLEVFARAGDVSLQRPSLLFLSSGMVREGGIGPEVPPDFGLERVGPVVLGAAPLEALDALAPLLEGDPWQVPPLGPRALKVGEHTVADEATGLTWQRRGSGPLRETPAHRHCGALELDGAFATGGWWACSAAAALGARSSG
jgi:hypothetical protein